MNKQPLIVGFEPMNDQPMTVGQLRAAMTGVPDDTPLLLNILTEDDGHDVVISEVFNAAFVSNCDDIPTYVLTGQEEIGESEEQKPAPPREGTWDMSQPGRVEAIPECFTPPTMPAVAPEASDDLYVAVPKAIWENVKQSVYDGAIEDNNDHGSHPCAPHGHDVDLIASKHCHEICLGCGHECSQHICVGGFYYICVGDDVKCNCLGFVGTPYEPPASDIEELARILAELDSHGIVHGPIGLVMMQDLGEWHTGTNGLKTKVIGIVRKYERSVAKDPFSRSRLYIIIQTDRAPMSAVEAKIFHENFESGPEWVSKLDAAKNTIHSMTAKHEATLTRLLAPKPKPRTVCTEPVFAQTFSYKAPPPCDGCACKDTNPSKGAMLAATLRGDVDTIDPLARFCAMIRLSVAEFVMSLTPAQQEALNKRLTSITPEDMSDMAEALGFGAK